MRKCFSTDDVISPNPGGWRIILPRPTETVTAFTIMELKRQ